MLRILLHLLAAGALAASAAAMAPGAHASGAASVEVKIFVPRGAQGGTCDRVVPLRRSVRAPAVLTGALRALLRGPTRRERLRGYGGWFSARTAGMLRSVRLSNGVAYADFEDFSRIIPNASTSCGSAMLLAQLDRTATQFPTVRRAVYSFRGSRRAFYEWLQLAPPRGAAPRSWEPVTPTAWVAAGLPGLRCQASFLAAHPINPEKEKR